MHTFRRLLSLLLILLTFTWAGAVASAEPPMADADGPAAPLLAHGDAAAGGADADGDGLADVLEMPALPALLPMVGIAPRPLWVAVHPCLSPSLPLAPPAPPPRLV